MTAHQRDMLNTAALYKALNNRRERRDISWNQVCREAGVIGSITITRLSRNKCPAMDNLCRLLLWMGETDLRPYLHARPLAALAGGDQLVDGVTRTLT